MKQTILLAFLGILLSGCLPKGAEMKYTLEIMAIDPDDLEHAVATAEILQQRISNIAQKGFTFERVSNTTYHTAFKTTMTPASVKKLLTTPGEFGFYELYTLNELPQIYENTIDSNKSIEGLPELNEKLKQYIIDIYNSRYASESSFPNLSKQYRDTLFEFLRTLDRKNILPRNAHTKKGVPQEIHGDTIYDIYIAKLNPALDGPIIDRNYIMQAKASREHHYNQLVITFNSEGAEHWEQITENNIGKQLAMVMDGVVLSAPKVTAKIEGGSVAISGDFNSESLSVLSIMLKTGSLKLPVEIQETE